MLICNGMQYNKTTATWGNIAHPCPRPSRQPEPFMGINLRPTQDRSQSPPTTLTAFFSSQSVKQCGISLFISYSIKCASLSIQSTFASKISLLLPLTILGSFKKSDLFLSFYKS